MRGRFRAGLIRVVTQDPERMECHGRLLEQWYPEVQVVSECIKDQPEGVHDAESEQKAVPKILALAETFERQGMDGVILSCAGDPGLRELRKRLRIPVVGAGESTAFVALRYGRKISTLGITAEAPDNYKRILGSRLIVNGVPSGVTNTNDLLTAWGKQSILEEAKKQKDLGAEAIALACTGMATIQIAPVLEKAVGIPVLDPVMCEGLVMYLELLRGRKE